MLRDKVSQLCGSFYSYCNFYWPKCRSYDCSDFLAEDTSMCHFKGKEYNISDVVEKADLPTSVAQCVCVKNSNPSFDSKTDFSCANIECPPVVTRCPGISIYDNLKKACRSKKICGQYFDAHSFCDEFAIYFLNTITDREFLCRQR